MNLNSIVAAAAGLWPRKEDGAMRRIAIATALAVVVATLGAASVGAAGRETNPNAGGVVLACDNGEEVTIWVNLIGSDRSGGGAPAIVVDGDAGHVYKVISASVAGETVVTHFHGAPRFDRVICTHDSPWGLVTLTGVFIP